MRHDTALRWLIGVLCCVLFPLQSAWADCERIVHDDTRQLCRALSTASAGPCDRIVNDDVRQTCRARVTAKATPCDRVVNDDARQFCRGEALRLAAATASTTPAPPDPDAPPETGNFTPPPSPADRLRTQARSHCERIVHDDTRQHCRARVSATTSFCDRIVHDDIRQACHAVVKGQVSRCDRVVQDDARQLCRVEATMAAAATAAKP